MSKYIAIRSEMKKLGMFEAHVSIEAFGFLLPIKMVLILRMRNLLNCEA